MALMTCLKCGKSIERRSAVQKYCTECSCSADRERKRKWAKDNPQILTKEEVKRNSDLERSKNVLRGLQNNKPTVHNVAVYNSVNLQWLVKVSVPFSYSASKNHIWSYAGRGHVFKRQESRAMEDEIILLLKNALRGKKVFKNKVWLDIYVQKPNHRGDAINVVDLVADAVKKAIEIDDRWFSIRRVDWQIVKENPRMFIGVGQEDAWDAQICSYCGRILPLERFGKSKRECKECTSSKRKKIA